MVSETILALHRYYVWANRMRTHFDALIEEQSRQPRNQATFDIEARMYMSYWYASLYVVIEGWVELKLSDSVIDPLLRSPNVALLKRYRHGTFHYQKNYNDRRFLELIEKGVKVVEWIRALNLEFGRWFLSALNEQRRSGKG